MDRGRSLPTWIVVSVVLGAALSLIGNVIAGHTSFTTWLGNHHWYSLGRLIAVFVVLLAAIAIVTLRQTRVEKDSSKGDSTARSPP